MAGLLVSVLLSAPTYSVRPHDPAYPAHYVSASAADAQAAAAGDFPVVTEVGNYFVLFFGPPDFRIVITDGLTIVITIYPDGLIVINGQEYTFGPLDNITAFLHFVAWLGGVVTHLDQLLAPAPAPAPAGPGGNPQ
jgi:hypothetical protein